jgi:predicted membrane protein
MRDEDSLRERRDRLSSPTPHEPGQSRPKRRFSSQFVVGTIIVIVGASLLLDNLGLMSSQLILRFWPVILVFAGLRDLLVTRNASRAMRGTLFLAFGSLLLMRNLDVFSFNVMGLWPLFLILFGVQMLVRGVTGPEILDGDSDSASEFDDFAFLGGVKRSITSGSFRGGAASAFMGGVDLDLSRAAMQGDRVVVNVFAMMGGIVLRIPDNWSVESNVAALLGGVEDKTRPPADPVGTLVLEGSAIMGGIEIKD